MKHPRCPTVFGVSPRQCEVASSNQRALRVKQAIETRFMLQLHDPIRGRDSMSVSPSQALESGLADQTFMIEVVSTIFPDHVVLGGTPRWLRIRPFRAHKLTFRCEPVHRCPRLLISAFNTTSALSLTGKLRPQSCHFHRASSGDDPPFCTTNHGVNYLAAIRSHGAERHALQSRFTLLTVDNRFQGC